MKKQITWVPLVLIFIIARIIWVHSTETMMPHGLCAFSYQSIVVLMNSISHSLSGEFILLQSHNVSGKCVFHSSELDNAKLLQVVQCKPCSWHYYAPTVFNKSNQLKQCSSCSQQWWPQNCLSKGFEGSIWLEESESELHRDGKALVCRMGWWHDWRIKFHFTCIQYIVLILLLGCQYINTMHKFQI